MSLKDNPFYILKLSCKASRREIASAAEELGFVNESDLCVKAQNELSSPSKRLGAEVDWFVDADDAQLEQIRSCIENQTQIPTDGLYYLSRLNASLYNFSLIDSYDIYDIGFAILDIDEQFSELDIEDITGLINGQHEIAKIALVQEQDVSTEFVNKRTGIKSIISDKLALLDEDSYVDLITKLAEHLVDITENGEGGVILSDVIDLYEVKMQSTLEELTEDVRKDIEKIKQIDDDSESKEINALIWKVQTWDKYAQPLQLKSQASGMPHEISEDLGRELRQLAIYLHNEKEKTKEALRLVDAMQGVFAELEGLADLFESDSSTLNELIRGEKEAEELKKEFDAIQKESERLSTYADETRVNEFINHVIKINAILKSMDWSDDAGTKLREGLCIMARGTAVELHNSKNQTAFALRITEMLRKEFEDISSLRTKLLSDEFTLRQQLIISNGTTSRSPRTNAQNSSSGTAQASIYNSGSKAAPRPVNNTSWSGSSGSKSSGTGAVVTVFVIVAILLLFVIVPSCNSSSSSSSSSSTTKTTTSSSSSTTYKVTFDRQSGSGGSSYVYASKDKAMPSASAPTRTGYDFKGYFSSPNGKGTMYYDSNMRNAHSWDRTYDSTLYAYWVKKVEKKYSASASAGDLVYVDIVSIFPEIGIYTQGTTNYTEFVCKCKTSSGSTVWVYMTCNEYKNKFDSSASTSIFSPYQDEKTFSSSKRIHGEVRRADSIMSGLSSDTGTYVIDFSSVG